MAPFHLVLATLDANIFHKIIKEILNFLQSHSKFTQYIIYHLQIVLANFKF